ncbi:DUF1302 domain-containing protein [Roseateles koreensis]|uniref:DUF1302 domain-containing protein n=1 Tax=Roseateles koreensis TaxID=2987526 RepID=A0ABT5KTY7_9BURK|nr:DUF1302 domain-containing protein [Roseateles koreensis]MDC8786394.1 DUF1302 domain-containing protein [Roseateles koreensis]
MTTCPKTALHRLALAASLCAAATAQAATFETESIKGNFDSTVSIALALRTAAPSCDLVLQGATGSGAPAGCMSPLSALGDQGNLNYGKGDLFAAQLKGTHELLLKLPEDVTFMARANWVRDFAATRTTGLTSATTPPGLDHNLADDAHEDLKFKGRLLDLWVSKKFQIGGQDARIRVGNQVVSWGESLFLPGGINASNAMDYMRLSQPGTQLKEVFLPAPMVSVASGLGHGLNAEAYVQTDWNRSYLPPTGSYWSVVNGLGKGHDTYGLADIGARKTGQWGASLRYQPDGTQLNLGLYAMNYHDKTPQFSYNIKNSGTMGWTYPEDRQMLGISANFPVGEWAVGTELSYRPKDAVALNSNAGCTSQNGNCWVDQKRLQWHLTGLLSLQPSGTGQDVLKALGADTGTLLAEAVVIHFPGLNNSYGGDPISAGGWGWGNETPATATTGVPTAVGTKTSSGINFDFSLTYDGTVIEGWQVVPEVYYFQALSGRTPNSSAIFMAGAKSVNFVVSLLQNPASWQFALNYTKFWGGSSPLDQPYKDRDFLGVVLSRNF